METSDSMGNQVDLPQTLDLYNWLDDLTQIKDALGVEAGYVSLTSPSVGHVFLILLP